MKVLAEGYVLTGFGEGGLEQYRERYGPVQIPNVGLGELARHRLISMYATLQQLAEAGQPLTPEAALEAAGLRDAGQQPLGREHEALVEDLLRRQWAARQGRLWVCWVCGTTQAKNGKPLREGYSSANHLRGHEHEGLLHRTPAQRRKDRVVFTLTTQGQAYVEARQRQEVPALAPQLPSRGTMLRRIYDLIGEYPGVRITAQEIADECDVYLRKASAFAHTLAKRGLVQMESGGRGRQSEFWVDV